MIGRTTTATSERSPIRDSPQWVPGNDGSIGLHTLQRKRVEAGFPAVLCGKTFPQITVLSARRKIGRR